MFTHAVFPAGAECAMFTHAVLTNHTANEKRAQDRGRPSTLYDLGTLSDLIMILSSHCKKKTRFLSVNLLSYSIFIERFLFQRNILLANIIQV